MRTFCYKILLVPILTFLSMLTSASASTDELTFRGVKIGISVSEFRKLSHPDRNESWLAGTKLKVFCTGEGPKNAYGLLKLTVSAEQRSAGVTKCDFFNFGPYGSLNDQGIGIPIWGGMTAYEFFSANPKEEARLFSISIRFPEKQFDRVVQSFSNDFGVPQSDSAEIVRNGMGAEFRSRLVTWERPKTSLVIAQRVGTVDTSILNLVDKAVYAKVRIRMQRGVESLK